MPVTLACGAINLLWLLPLAALVKLGEFDSLTGVLIGHALVASWGVTVIAGAVIGTLARIDDDAIVNAGAVVDHDAHLGRRGARARRLPAHRPNPCAWPAVGSRA